MRRLAVLASVVTLGGSGCAARSTVDLAKLNQRLEELAQRESDKQRQIDELNNRLFLLEDKVDTSRVAMERGGKRPQLPVIRLRPKAEEDEGQQPLAPTVRRRATIADDEGEAKADGEPDGEDGDEEQPTGGKSLVERKTVAYGGAARRAGPRPMLRLYESSGGGGSSGGGIPGGSGGSAPRDFSAHGPDPLSVSEKLAVVPIPRRASAIKRAAAPAVEVTPMREYNEAMNKYKAGQLAAAAEAFRAFFKRYGRHAYADNALYWMAECSYDAKNYRLAVKLFRQVVEEYPDGNKAPDALLKMAYSYIRLKEEKNARTVLAQVVETFPKSQVARLASETLAKLQ